MWPHGVVVLASLLDDRLRLCSCSKPFEIEALIAEASIEGFIHSVLPRLPWVDVDRLDARIDALAKKRHRDEFRAIVAAQSARQTASFGDSTQHRDDLLRLEATVYFDRE